MRMINRLAGLIGTWLVGRRRVGSVLDISFTSCCGAGWTIPFFLFAVKLSANDQTAKEIVHSNMKILSSFTYPCVISI